MTALGIEESGTRNAGAWMAEKIGRAKIGFTGGDTSDLRTLQTLETLYLGVTGKRLLWQSLQAARDTSPVLERTDFDRLTMRATEQLERIEAQRVKAAKVLGLDRHADDRNWR